MNFTKKTVSELQKATERSGDEKVIVEVKQNSMNSSHSSGHGDFQVYDEAADYVSDSSVDDSLEIITQTETPGPSSDPFTVDNLIN